jgi:ATP-dependent helicase/nuclease subunit A
MTTSPADDVWVEWRQAIEGQASAAEPDANAWVAANAGSGKTKVLIDRVARLLLRGAEPDSILCVTYTKAAASEMQDRLFKRLGDWCVAEDTKLRADLRDLEHREDFSDEEVGRARQLFARALETPGGLRIETIHAFCGRLLKRFPLEAGIAPGFRELDDEDSDELWASAFVQLGTRVAHGEPELVAAARAVAEAGGAGFEVLRRLDAHRGEIEALVSGPGGIEAAIADLQALLGAPSDCVADIVGEAMGAGLPRKLLQDLAAALPVIKAADAELARVIAFALSGASAEERFDAYASLAFTDKGDLRKKNCYTADALKSAPGVADLFQIANTPEGTEITRIQQVAQKLAARRVFERSEALLRLAEPLLADFARRKAARAGLDFDDLIDRVARLLSRSHAAEWVLWKLDGGIAHVLLDEAQDTSPAQWEILRALTNEIFAGAGVERASTRTLFVVGDQKQSIYSFQGADPEHFLHQAREVHAMAAAAEAPFNTPSLAMSFRSVQQVLSYVDEVFDPAHFAGGAPFSVQVPVEAEYAPHTARRRNEPGSVELWPLEKPLAVEDPDPWHAPVDQMTESAPPVKLGKQIAQFIKREIDSGAAVWEGGKQRPARPGDFLILVKRRTGGIFDAILQQLKALNLPVAGADRIQLLDSLPVQDLLNLVRFALCPEDDLTLAEILKGPFGASKAGADVVWMNDDDLFQLASERKGSLWAEVRKSGSVKATTVRDFLEDVLARRHQPPFEFLANAMERGTGLPAPGWELMLRRFGGPAREPVTALIDRAAAFDADSPPSLEGFLAAVENTGGEVKRELSHPEDEVRVMTVHGAKGLQAPIVILPDTTTAPKLDRSGLFFADDGMPVWVGPKSGDTALTAAMREEADQRALREHRRLLYVALTRAQDRLVVCGAWYGKSKTGRDKDSWYELCVSGMERLIEKRAAAPVADPLMGAAGPLLRVGAEMPKLSAKGSAAGVSAALPAWLRQPAKPEAVNRVLSPSRLVAAGEPPVISPFDGRRSARLRRGSLIHLMFEILPSLPPDQRRDAARRFLDRQPDLSGDERAEMLAAAMGVLDDKRFAAVFGPGGRAEAPVIGRIGADTINGRVDRLVITEREILVVDYKTDRPAPPSVEAVGEAYIAQMAAYRAVLSQRWPERPVRCLLVWTDGPRLMEIPASALDQQALRSIPA